MSSNVNQTDEYLIKITESGPQIIDRKKSFFLLNTNKNVPKSPRRDTIPSFNSISNFKKKELSAKEKELYLIREKLDQKITENIQKRQGIDTLLDDPEIEIFIKNN